MMGSMEMLLDRVGSDPVSHDLALASLEAAHRGARLASYLLSSSRQQLLQPAALDLSAVLKELIGTLQRTLGPTIGIRVDIELGLNPVLAGAAHLNSALLNLALNARDAMPDGGVLDFKAYASGGQVVIQVTDTGVGMTAEVLSRAQEPFFTTKGVGGSGLGLSMVQGFAQQSGGSLVIRSEPDRGTQIEPWLPETTAKTPPAADRAGGVPILHGTGRILVVDDSLPVRLIVEAFLEQAGFEVIGTTDAETAIDILQSDHRFDGLVTDYLMPGMNGAQLISWARAAFPNLPAVMVTGYGAAEVLETLPVDVVILRKPVQRTELVGSVKAMTADQASAMTRGPFSARDLTASIVSGHASRPNGVASPSHQT